MTCYVAISNSCRRQKQLKLKVLRCNLLSTARHASCKILHLHASPRLSSSRETEPCVLLYTHSREQSVARPKHSNAYTGKKLYIALYIKKATLSLRLIRRWLNAISRTAQEADKKPPDGDAFPIYV